jgi:hypothetical protein
VARRKLAWSTAISPGRALFDTPDDPSVNRPSALLNGPRCAISHGPGAAVFSKRLRPGYLHLSAVFADGGCLLALRSLSCASGEQFPPEVLRQKVE